MRTIFNHTYPGVSRRWRRVTGSPLAAGAPSLVASTLAALEGFVRPSELRVELELPTETVSAGVAVHLPPGLDAVLEPGTFEQLSGDRLDAIRTAEWLSARLGTLSESLDSIAITTGSVEVRAPAWIDPRPPFRLVADGETRWLTAWESDGAIWLAGPAEDGRVPAPVEVSIIGRAEGWQLDINLIWSLWERGPGEFEPELEACARTLEAAGWSTW